MYKIFCDSQIRNLLKFKIFSIAYKAHRGYSFNSEIYLHIMANETHLQAVKYIKSHKKELIERFANNSICSSEKNPVSIFMAGSPGAGKTEFSKNFIKKFSIQAVRIDADEIKDFLPHYNKKNSSEVQGASALGVEYLHDYALKAQKSMVLDGTFADYQKAYDNISRSLRKGRHTEIYYVYQDPFTAWEFTKAREALEGRKVPKELFVDALFNAKKNVNRIKLFDFGNRIQVNVVLKNLENNLDKAYFDVESVNPYVTITYTKYSLLERL